MVAHFLIFLNILLRVIIILGDWARPIFGLASDFKILSRDEREERDFAHLQAAKRRKRCVESACSYVSASSLEIGATLPHHFWHMCGYSEWL